MSVSLLRHETDMRQARADGLVLVQLTRNKCRATATNTQQTTQVRGGPGRPPKKQRELLLRNFRDLHGASGMVDESRCLLYLRFAAMLRCWMLDAAMLDGMCNMLLAACYVPPC